jgi:tRNA nucleotidyltransferase/poly(A) polymerase
MNEVNVNIADNLTPLETKIFELIDGVRKKRAPNTVVRVVGGWTRDKLLGQPSDDIDFMVDNMSGSDFANLVVEELGLKKSPHVIQENPEKTKNIEAAKMHVPIDDQQVELDFVQARTEEYGENRREVITRPATAEEDAMRRDLTIGALFYNVNEKKVEDFTGKGLKDLIAGTVRTPYDTGDKSSVEEVKKTFIEDPLRVFRAIRFAAKYNGNISPATRTAIEDPEVIDAIFFSERKIATERIGQEFQKMIKGPNPALAIKLLKETGLMQHLLNESLRGTDYEDNLEKLDMEQNNPHHEMTIWGHTYQVLLRLLEYFPEDDEEKRIIMILAALTHDLGKLYRNIHGESKSHPGRTSYPGHEEESKFIAEHLLRFLKFENQIIKQVAGLARYHMQPHSLERGDSATGAMRKFIRRMGEQSLNWVDVINLATADAYSKGADINPETIQSYQELRNQLEQALATMQIDDKKVKPILNGHQIMKTLDVNPGPVISVVQDYLKDLMDQYPETTEEEAIARLNQIKDRAQNMMNDDQNPTQLEDYIVKMIQSEVKTASGSSKYISACVCPQHLFKKTHGDVQRCLSENKLTEAIAFIRELCKKYPEDDKVARMATISMFNVLSKNPKLRDNDLLQFALDRTESSFFDPVLHSYATGLLILLKTVTEPDAILQIGTNMAKMNPGILRGVLDALPKKVYHDDIRQKLKAAVDENI